MRQKKIWTANWAANDGEAWRRSGGQGKLQLLRSIKDVGAPQVVLKELNIQNDLDRRSRMRREIIALETLPHPSTPRVLEHNTEKFDDINVDLYAIFEFIPGPTLQEHVAKQGPLSLEASVTLALSLLEIVEFYHSAGIGHRDIKPDNIILRSIEPLSPVLIDFGLTFNINEHSVNETPDWQQVGNRFLSLPEHAAFSANKRDLRSDISFCVAILFFAITGAHPATLINGEGQLPHQRPEHRDRLDALPKGQRLTLFYVFDIGFSLSLAQRWQNVDALRAHIKRIAHLTDDNDGIASIADIKARAEAKRDNMAIKSAIDHVRFRIKGATHKAVEKMGQGYEANIEERITTMSDMSSWIRCGVLSVYDGRITNTYYGIKAVGDELVIRESLDRTGIEGVVIERMPTLTHATSSGLEKAVERRIIENVHKSIDGL